MTDQPAFAASLPPEPQLDPGLWAKLFLRDSWIACIARVILYVALVFGIGFGVAVLARLFRPPGPAVFTPERLFVQEATGAFAVLLSALILSRLERRSPGAYGLPVRAAFGKLFWQGFLLGLAEVSALIGLIAAFGGYSFGALAVHGTQLARWAVFWTVLFILVGLFEEFLFRGYVQYTLGAGIGFWPAAIIFSVLFGAVHLMNQGEGWVGALSVVEVGVFLAFTLRRTGNLWFAVGLHASFDWGETFLYSVPNSGMTAEGHLSNAALHGPAWLTGGTVGPEGSVFSFLTIVVLFYVIHKLFPAKSNSAAPRS